mmetsp:Transcript_14242/g.36896  ORF Transcript_14242/g.36896 Transcript_14242/m.36896 type:complete len:221 (-) Transcript_14242:17-679(-)
MGAGASACATSAPSALSSAEATSPMPGMHTVITSPADNSGGPACPERSSVGVPSDSSRSTRDTSRLIRSPRTSPSKICVVLRGRGTSPFAGSGARPFHRARFCPLPTSPPAPLGASSLARSELRRCARGSGLSSFTRASPPESSASSSSPLSRRVSTLRARVERCGRGERTWGGERGRALAFFGRAVGETLVCTMRSRLLSPSRSSVAWLRAMFSSRRCS